MMKETEVQEGGIDMQVIVRPEHLSILPIAGGSGWGQAKYINRFVIVKWSCDPNCHVGINLPSPFFLNRPHCAVSASCESDRPYFDSPTQRMYLSLRFQRHMGYYLHSQTQTRRLLPPTTSLHSEYIRRNGVKAYDANKDRVNKYSTTRVGSRMRGVWGPQWTSVVANEEGMYIS